MNRFFKENGIKIQFAPGDKELMSEHTVDFISFSYYMSVVAAHDPESYSSGRWKCAGWVAKSLFNNFRMGLASGSNWSASGSQCFSMTVTSYRSLS